MILKPKTKLKAIGCKKISQIDDQILNQQSALLFKDPHPGNIKKSDGAQYYSNFLEDIGTNLKQAKWKTGKVLVFIEIIPQTTKKFDIGLLRKAFECFYMNVSNVVLEEKLTLVLIKKEFYLENTKLGVSVKIQTYPNEENQRINLSSSHIIKAQRQLISKYLKWKDNQPLEIDEDEFVLTESKIFSSISFIDHPIIIECSPQNVITGRANGYDGAVISLKGCCMREIMTTALHECLHIFSIDHCIWWDCIMNYNYEHSDKFSIGGEIHLCPSCLSKLHYQLEFDIVERYRRLYKFFSEIGYQNDAEFIQQIVKTMKKY